MLSNIMTPPMALRRVAAFFVLSLALNSPVQAAEPGVEVHVIDAATKAPVHLARVILQNDTPTVGYTDALGVVQFDHVGDGTYTIRVVRRGYTSLTSDAFDVAGSRDVRVDVSLAPDTLRVIGQVVSHSTTKISTTTLDPTNPIDRLSGSSLSGALGNLSDTQLGSNGLSIDGKDPSQTGIEIDGTPVGGLGGPSDLRGLNLDLFNAASVSSSSNTFSVGGTLGLTTLEPTIAMQTSNTLTYSTFGKSFWHLWARNTIGRLGIVYSHASSGANGPTDGLVYTDASGLNYAHRSGQSSRGDLVKLRLPFSEHRFVTGTFMASGSVGDIVCERISGPVPCGFGPNNTQAGSGNLALLKYDFHAGDFQYSAAIEHLSARAFDDESNRFVNGVPNPISSYGQSTLDAIFANLLWYEPLGSTSLNLGMTRNKFTQNIAAAFSSAGGGTSSLVSATLAQHVHIGDNFDADASLSFQRNFIDKPLGASAGATWRASHSDTVSARLTLRNGGGSAISAGALRDPASLVYDCGASIIFGATNGDPPTPSSVSEGRFSWLHRFTSGSASIEVARQVQHGTNVATILNGTALGTNQLPQAYVNSISAFYGTPAGCGTPANISASNLYFTQSISGVTRVYSTARLSLGLSLSPSMAIGGYVHYTDARALGNDPRLTNAASVSIPGRQLPNIPRWTAGLAFDYKKPNSPGEFLAFAQYVGINNDRNLPAYVNLAMGTSYDLLRGTLTAAVSNVTNQYVGTFTSPQYAVAYPTAGGGYLQTLASPLRPRAFSLTYSLRTGNVGPQVANPASLGEEAATPSVRFGRLPSSPPTDPFVLDRVDPNCTPELLPGTTLLLDTLRHAAADLEAMRSKDGHYPDNFEIQVPPGSPEQSLRYHRTGSSYAISIIFASLQHLAIACVDVVAAGDAQTATKNGIFTDASLPARTLEFVFTPRFGVYVVFHGMLMKVTPPKKVARPADPLAVREDCPSSQAPLIKAVIGVLRQLDFSRKAPLALDNGVVIRAHTASGGNWAEIRFPDPLTRSIFEGCTYVAVKARADVPAATGVADPLSINFSPTLGLYELP